MSLHYQTIHHLSDNEEPSSITPLAGPATRTRSRALTLLSKLSTPTTLRSRRAKPIITNTHTKHTSTLSNNSTSATTTSTTRQQQRRVQVRQRMLAQSTNHHIMMTTPVTQVVSRKPIKQHSILHQQLNQQVQQQQQHHHHHHHQQQQLLHQQQQQQPPRDPNAVPIPNLKNVVIKSRWRIGAVLGKGAFGEVFSAADTSTHQTVAIKVESPECKKHVLKLEICVMRKLQECPFVAKFIGCGRFATPQSHSHHPITPTSQTSTPTKQNPPTPAPQNGASQPVYSYLVMQLLGPNLSDLRRKAPNGQFSAVITSVITRQMLRAVQALHEIGFLHRDIKPGNFCLGPNETELSAASHCFMIDFGLSRRYLSSNGKVREPRCKVGFRGTARYASIAAHEGRDLGRVDDLWSLFYILVECLRGSLPWKGKEKSKIAALKVKYTLPDLPATPTPQQQQPTSATIISSSSPVSSSSSSTRCNPASRTITADKVTFPHGLLDGLPVQCWYIYQHLMTLGYGQVPNYDYLYTMLEDLAKLGGGNGHPPALYHVSSVSSLGVSSPVSMNLHNKMQDVLIGSDNNMADEDDDEADDEDLEDVEEQDDEVVLAEKRNSLTPSTSRERLLLMEQTIQKSGNMSGLPPLPNQCPSTPDNMIYDGGAKRMAHLIKRLSVNDSGVDAAKTGNVLQDTRPPLRNDMDVDDDGPTHVTITSPITFAPKPPLVGRPTVPYVRRKTMRTYN
ncbi:hypothetical protein SmJEL517_g02150 [Synchytrium microbalum]|uniref:non-specific serine/threonine protein kinase n=1 Tax=Synchytrium microbalum TaxID=1806994 RepID=A0A507C7C4_9FUNG|nr:uncharacterized protein SmJEL517_g02150 [Synchytrium microbalum]TPX35502.1 hypothetical protein SmJEL517_g02150 [Synchytrium microbalum]